MKIRFEVELSDDVVKAVENQDMHGEDIEDKLIALAEDMVALGTYKVRFVEEEK